MQISIRWCILDRWQWLTFRDNQFCSLIFVDFYRVVNGMWGFGCSWCLSSLPRIICIRSRVILNDYRLISRDAKFMFSVPKQNDFSAPGLNLNGVLELTCSSSLIRVLFGIFIYVAGFLLQFCQSRSSFVPFIAMLVNLWILVVVPFLFKFVWYGARARYSLAGCVTQFNGRISYSTFRFNVDRICLLNIRRRHSICTVLLLVFAVWAD